MSDGSPIEARPQTPTEERSGLVHDLLISAAGGGIVEGVKYAAGQLRPTDDQPSSAPPVAENPTTPNATSATDWDWPKR